MVHTGMVQLSEVFEDDVFSKADWHC